MSIVKNHVVLKLGGSLMENAPQLLIYLKDNLNLISYTAPAVLIVPGGGVFADSIREVHRKEGIGDYAAHWMAILGMEQYAYYLADKSGIRTTDDLDKIVPGITILMPYRLLYSMDPLPHSWDVTSDCIAAWVASMLSARLVKATDVDGVLVYGKTVATIDAVKLNEMGESCVDRMLPELLMKDGRDCMIVNGNYPERVLAALEEKAVIGTLIKGNI
ncbi:MAG: amino acid kinase [Methanomethylovorans sp.]|uniref:amino acid kinase family protein n=1 Tax=Methanomethylovorans sp. TaxID=2758717 RepID=UPI003530CA93